MQVDVDGTIIEGLDISGVVIIDADNVILRNCRVRSTDTFVVVWVHGTNARIERCDIAGIIHAGGQKAIWIDGAKGCKVLRCDLSNCDDGIYASGSGHLIRANYIHDMASGGNDPHFDGVQLEGGDTDHVTITGNNIVMAIEQNSAITMGVVQNVKVDANRLYGGGYTTYCDARFGEGVMSKVSFTNNRYGTHNYGYTAFEECPPGVPVFIGNVDDITGLPISAGQ
jgi:Nitrous oxidase accessory protein